MAAQEGDIMNFAQRLAGTGSTVGMAQKDIMALSASMASVGIRAEAGGSAMSKVMSKMNTAVKDGGDKLNGFAKVAGVSASEFAETWKKDPYKAIQQFENGLKNQNQQGKNVKETLKGLGITELRETDTVLRLANGNKQLANARKYADDGFKNGNALSKEAEQKYKTLGNQLKIFMNHLRSLGKEIGAALAPAMIGLMKILIPVIDALAKAPSPVKAFVAALALIPVIAVPVLATLAAITGSMGLVGQAMNTATAAAGSGGKALKLYAFAVNLLTSPVKTARARLSNLANSLRGTGKASADMKKNTITAGTGLNNMITPMGKLSTQSKGVSKGMSTVGTAAVASGSKAGKAGGLFAKLGRMFKFLVPAGGLLTGTFEVLAAVIGLVSAPVLAIVGAIAALGVAFVIAYKKVKWFRDGVNGLLTVFKVFGGGIIGSVVKGIKSLGHWFGWVGGVVKNKATQAIKGWYNSLPNNGKVKTAVNAIKVVGGAFKGVMKTLGTANNKDTDMSNVLGKGISSGTKKALGQYVKLSQQSTRILAKMRYNNGKVTSGLKNDLINSSRAASVELITQQKKRNKGNLSQLQKMLKDTNVYTGKEAQAIVSRAKKAGDAKVKKTQELTKQINDLESKALADGKLSEKERKAIQKKYNERNKIAAETLTKGQKEQRAIMSRLDANTGAIDKQEAQKTIKEIIAAQDKAIKDAKSKRDKQIMEADEALANGTITKKEHDNIVKKVTSRYDTEVKAAKSEGNKAKAKIKKASPGIENSINMDNGKAYSKAQQWWNSYVKGVKESWNNNKKAFSDIGNWIGQQSMQFGAAFKNGWNSAMSKMGDMWGWIKNTGGNLGSWFSQKGQQLSKFFKDGWSNASKSGGDLWSWIKTTGGNLGSWFSEKGKQFSNMFRQGWNNVKNGDLWSWIKNTGASIGGWFVQKGQSLWSNLKQGWSNAVATTGDIWSSIKSTGASIGGWFVTKGQQFWSGIKSGWNNAVTTSGNLWSALITKLGSMWAGIRGWFVTKGASMASGIKSGWNGAISGVAYVFTQLWAKLKAIWSGISGTFTYWTAVIWGRVKSVFGWIGLKIGGSLSGAWARVRAIWKGMQGTFVYWTGAIWGRVKAVFGWIGSRISSSLSGAWAKVRAIWKGMKGTFVYWTGAIWNRVKAVFGWIKSRIGSSLTGAWKTTQRIWKGIKGTFTYWTGAIWNRVKSVFGWIKGRISSSLNGSWKIVQRVWKGIKNTISYWTGAIWNRIKSVFSWIKNRINSVHSAIWKNTSRVWKAIKNTVSYWVGAMWNRVKSVFSNMRNGISSVMSKIRSAMGNAWKHIKNHSVDMVTGMWSRVRSVFSSMKKGVQNFGSSVKKHISDMVGGVKKGLNGLIGGVNWVGKKLGVSKKIPTLSTGTESTHTQNFVRNGAISQPTLATVNDKGPGNGTGRTGHQELIQRKNGNVYAPQGKDVTVPLEKGDKVINGKSTQRLQKQGIIPKFSKGTSKKPKNITGLELLGGGKKPKKHKHNEFLGGDVPWGTSGGGLKDVAAGIAKGSKAVVAKGSDIVKGGASKAKEAAKSIGTTVAKGAGWLKKNIGELEDYLDNPGKLLDKLLEGFGVNFDMVKGEIPTMLWDAMWKGLKNAAKSMISGWLEDEFSGGDGGYIDLSKGINFGFARTAAEAAKAGYPFSRPHHGLDINYKHDKVYSTMSGTAQAFKGWSGGFGNHMEVTNGNLKSIYGHLHKLAFTGSKKVKPGTFLGISGGDPGEDGQGAGSSTGLHLHYEMQRNGVAFDPTSWLKKHNGGGKGGKAKAASAWKGDIRRAAARMHVKVSESEVNGIASLINAESSGNPRISQQIKDVNSGGNEAQGLLQYVPSTFRSYAVKGHKNIYSGFDQLLAFFNNSNWRRDYNPNGGWGPSGHRRYAHGGMIKKHGLYEAGEGNREEMILPLTNKVRAMQLIEQAKSFMGIEDEPETITGSQQGDNMLVELMKQNNALLQTLINVVDGKELNLDGQAITNSVNQGLGSKYNQSSYHSGKKTKR